jgi:hypothetical protein
MLGRGLCDELISRPEESYRVWCVQMSVMWIPQELGGPDPRWGSREHTKGSQFVFDELSSSFFDWLNSGIAGVKEIVAFVSCTV